MNTISGDSMKTLAQQMAGYAAYHRDPRNRLTHVFGVPAIVVGMLIPMAWLQIDLGGWELSAAMIFVFAVLVYYFLLDVGLALGMSAIMLPVVTLTEWLASTLPTGHALTTAALCFFGGWVLQLIGHAIEGRRPALVDNLWQIFVAPLFLLGELYFALGYKQSVKKEIDAQTGINH